jgi:hypothetical protein
MEVAMVTIINGRVIGGGDDENKKKPAKTVDNIPAGSEFEHDGPVVVLNKIGADAVVKITNGSLTAKDVEDGAKIKVTQDSDGDSSTIVSVTTSRSSFNSISSTSISTGDTAEIKITGHVGDDVTLVADHSVNMKHSGDNLHAKAGHSFDGLKIGAKACIQAGHNVSIYEAGDGAELMSGHNMKLGIMGKGGSAQAGHSFNSAYVDEKCTVMSGHNMDVRKAHQTASLGAGHKKHVGTVFGQSDTSSRQTNNRKNRFDF